MTHTSTTGTAAAGTATAYVKVIKIGEARTAATHAATEDDQVAFGNKPRKSAKAAEISANLRDATCRACRAQLGIDADVSPQLEALWCDGVPDMTVCPWTGSDAAGSWEHGSIPPPALLA